MSVGKEQFVFLDVETTGLDSKKNAIHQLSGCIDIDRRAVQAFNFRVKPFEQDEIEDIALEIGHTTRAQLDTFTPPEVVFAYWTKLLDKYVLKYNKNDKFVFVGYNSPFDKQFMVDFHVKNKHNYFFSYFRSADLCVMRMYMERCVTFNKFPPNFKLANVCKQLGLAEPDDKRWHDAMFDVRMTRAAFYMLKDWEAENPSDWDAITLTNSDIPVVYDTTNEPFQMKRRSNATKS